MFADRVRCEKKEKKMKKTSNKGGLSQEKKEVIGQHTACTSMVEFLEGNELITVLGRTTWEKSELER